MIFAQLNGTKIIKHGIRNKYFVHKIILHDYNQWTMDFDIGILKLNVTESSLKKYEALKIEDENPSFDASNCYIYGYGARSTYGNTTTSLNYGKVDIISLNECERLMGRVTAPQGTLNSVSILLSSIKFLPFLADTGKYCAMGAKIDFCHGDSGSGHVCKKMNGNGYVLRGTLTFEF